jgi:hypothetical protein
MTLARNQRHEYPRPHDHREPDRRMVASAGDGPGPPLCPDCDLLAGPFMTAAGMAALLAPGWFADAAGFPRHTHFVHDAGPFQLGLGVTLLLAVAWRDGLALVLAGFLVADRGRPGRAAGPARLGRR